MGTKRAIRRPCLIALVFMAMACTAQASTPGRQSAISTPPSSPASIGGVSAIANGYSYGSGTYYVAARRTVPPYWGNAKMWYARAQDAGYAVGTTPNKGAIAWADGVHGQVAIVEDVSADGTLVTVSEMNGPGGWNRVTTRTTSPSSFKYIY